MSEAIISTELQPDLLKETILCMTYISNMAELISTMEMLNKKHKYIYSNILIIYVNFTFQQKIKTNEPQFDEKHIDQSSSHQCRFKERKQVVVN